MPRQPPPSPRLPLKPRRLSATYMGLLAAAAMKRRKPKDRDDKGVPVSPDRPLNLSGGAAEPLEFED